MKKSDILLYIFLSLLVIFFILFRYLGLFQYIQYKIGLTLILFLIYFGIIFVLKKGAKINLLIIVALALFLRLLFFDSSLSDFSGDANRYIWDGKIQANHINPYLYPPDSSELESFRNKVIYPGINHKGYKTVYPPLAQMIFFLSYSIKADSFIALKSIYLFFEILTALFLLLLLKDKRYLSVYLLCPLVILEGFLGTHIDIAGLGLLFGAIYFFKKEKVYFSIFLLVASIMVKYITIITVPVFLIFYIRKLYSKELQNKASMYRDILGKSLFFIFLILLFYLPYIRAGKYIFESFILYNHRWKFNGFLHRFFINIFGMYARYFSVLTLALILFLIYFKLRSGLLLKLELTILSALLFNNALFPWYVLWLIPFFVFYQRWSTAYLIGIISISYYVFIKYKAVGIWQENLLFFYLQYLPFYSLLLYDILKGSYAKQIKNSSDHSGS
ncbi:MAG: hypothetical protein KKH98_05275 [Spirochaetes bacterium]|nr:hypothetical protein [Spirochaetota bacterium]